MPDQTAISLQSRLSQAFFGLTANFAQAKRFAFLLFALTLPFSFWIQWISPPAEDTLSLFYKATIPAYFGLLLFLICFLTSPLSLLLPGRWLYAFLGGAWLIYLIADGMVFNAYKFHINLFLIQFFFVDFQELGLPPLLLAAGLIAVTLTIGFAVFLARFAVGKHLWLGKLSSGVLVATIVIFLMNQLTHIWAERFHRNEITRYTSYFPAFYPAISQKNGEKLSQLLPSIFPAEEKGQIIGAGQQPQHVRYPLSLPSQCAPGKDANILFILLESWQASSLTQEVMPNITGLADTSNKFTRHISGGNATVPGLFSLMFGLHGSYYEAFRANPQANPSAFTHLLTDMGYKTNVFTSVGLRRFALQALFFPQVSDANLHRFNNEGSFWKSDHATIEHLVSSLDDKARQSANHFDFVFLTSSHFSYEYPDEFKKFLPLPEREGTNLLNRNIDPQAVKNDYHNSLNYEDHLVGKVFDKLRKTGLWDKTWIVILGDHAEEFNENGLGYWGHGSNFTRWQTQTPLLIKRPHQKEGISHDRLSTHQDIVPTLVEEALACKGNAETYSTGTNLFGSNEKAGTIITSYTTSAYWIDGTIAEKWAVGSGYAWQDMKEKRGMPPSQTIKRLIEEETRFLR